MGQRLCTNGTAVIVDPGTDPYINNVVLLMHFDGINDSTTFIDVKGKTITANGDAKITTAQGKFNQSGIFDGTGDYLSIPDSTDFDFGTGDFTFEAFIRLGVININQCIFAKYFSSSDRYFWFIDSNNKLVFDRQNPGGFDIFRIASTGAIPINTWTYIALTRSGNNFTQYINAVVDGITTDPSSVTGAGLFYIGSLAIDFPGFEYYFNGYMDEIRLTKGVARTISSVPIQAFPDI